MIAGAYILAIAVRFGAGEKSIGLFDAGSHVARGDRHAMRERSPTCWAITPRIDPKSLPKLQAYIEGPFNGMLRLFTENRDLKPLN